MSIHRFLRTVAFAGGIAIGAHLAHATPGAQLGIDGVDVEQVAELAAGVPLRFSVYGTPGATVALRIEGGWRVLALHESEPGVYEGTYVIDSRDAIGPLSRVSATLQQDGQLARADLAEPLLLAETPLPWADVAATAPTATAPVAPETAPSPRAVAAPVIVARAPERASCDDCAFVQSVRLVETPPGGPIGAVASRIANAVLGDELGQAHTRRMARLLGAFRGPTGREADRQASQRTQYDVVLRTKDGRSQVRRYDHAPPFAPGDTVRLGAVREASAPAPF